MNTDWEKRYRDKDTPWDTGVVSQELQNIINNCHIKPCKVLDVGCGTGTNSVYLASQGFQVTGVDASSFAIEQAWQKAKAANVSCLFKTVNLFDHPQLDGPFDFIFDRGCFHILRKTDEVQAVSLFKTNLRVSGLLLILAGNANDPIKEGPPKVSEEEFHHAFDQDFEFVRFKEFNFDLHPDTNLKPLGWSVLLKRKG